MIKLFEQFNNEQEIIDICNIYDIENYTINVDGSIDVDGDVDLCDNILSKIPLLFNKISGNLFIYSCGLKTLEGFPNYIGGDLDISLNNLTSLDGCPEYIGGSLICYRNKLTSLYGCPNYIKNIHCSNNKITTLIGIPNIVDGNLTLDENPISIIDTSIEVKDKITISYTKFDKKIKSLSRNRLKILFEHGIDYDIFRKDGSINDSRLERMFKDFNI